MLVVAWLLAVSCGADQVKKNEELRRVVIQHPSASSPFLSIVSEFSTELHGLDISDDTLPGPVGLPTLSGNVLFHPSDPLGCEAWPSLTITGHSATGGPLNIGMVERGTCTFLEKTKLAQIAGLNALIIVSNNDKELTPMSADETDLQRFKASPDGGRDRVILAVMASADLKHFIQKSATHQMTPLSLQRYAPKIWDSSMLVMVLVSTLLVGVGAWYSSDADRAEMYASDLHSHRSGLRQTAPVQELDEAAAWSFVLTASCGLLTLYFFAAYLFQVIIFVFCIGATNGLSTIFAHCIDAVAPALQNTQFALKRLELEFTLSDVLGFVPAAAVSLAWLLLRLGDYGWLLQNVMCVGLLLVLQRTLKMPNMRVAAILLSTAFAYDIFWVFVSPLFFAASPMIAVATYRHSSDARDTLPVVLKFPRIDDVFHAPMVLGLGDIALPGLFVSYLLRFDYRCKVGLRDSWRRGYFLPALLGYAVGMALTDLNLVLMRSGQPALLFLVPCTLGLTALLARYRGRAHLRRLWSAEPTTCTKVTKSEEFAFQAWHELER